MHYVYILRLRNNKHYIGFSSNPKKRIKEHEDGGAGQIKKFRPIQIVYYSCFEKKRKALEFERYLKTPSGFAFRNKRLI